MTKEAYKKWRKYYDANKDKILAYKSEWQKKNKKHCAEYLKEWHSRPENIGKNSKYVKKCLKKGDK